MGWYLLGILKKFNGKTHIGSNQPHVNGPIDAIPKEIIALRHFSTSRNSIIHINAHLAK